MTNLSEAHCYRLVDMLDLDKSGNLEFDEFYVLMCILISIKVRCCQRSTERFRMQLASKMIDFGRIIEKKNFCSNTPARALACLILMVAAALP